MDTSLKSYHFTKAIRAPVNSIIANSRFHFINPNIVEFKQAIAKISIHFTDFFSNEYEIIISKNEVKPNIVILDILLLESNNH